MIPIKLELYNFLAYRDPEPLDLTGLHLACLVGSNGAGKSSLLDAITWALWGKARTSRDDDLIHSTEIDMSVTLTFVANDQSYRVTRYRTRQGRGHSELSLEILDGDAWRNISENTIRATQNLIERQLLLDYDTFINSAYLVQGRADEFTKKTPGNRKAILGEILGLDQWGIYEDRTKQKLKDLEQDHQLNEREISEIDLDLAQEGQYRQALETALQHENTVLKELSEVETSYNELQAADSKRNDLQTRLAQEVDRLKEDEIVYQQTQQDHDAETTRLEELNILLQTQEDIEQGYNALIVAREQDKLHAEALMQQQGLHTNLQNLEKTIAAERSTIESQRSALAQQQKSLERTMAEVEEHAALREKEVQITELENLEQTRDDLRNQHSALREQHAGLDADNRNLSTRMDAIKEDIGKIEASSEPVCPLCGQELSDTHREDLLQQLRDEGKVLGDQWRENKTVIDQLSAQIDDLQKQISNADIELRNLPALRNFVAQAQLQFDQARGAKEELKGVLEELTGLETRLESGDYAHGTQAQLSGVHAQLAELGYNEQAHREARDAIDTNLAYETRKLDLERAVEEIPQIEGKVADYVERLTGWENRIADRQTQINEFEASLTELNAQLKDYANVQTNLNRLREAKAQAGYQVGRAEQAVNALEGRRLRRGELVALQQEIGVERGIYEDLRAAFSKNGVPAMIIEAVIPEIENEANQLLGRMTEGRMTVRFDTQREKVTGGVRETLDILIADELGTRDYETFSGGKSFRVNFAIRLALSRLLARRSGAQLRTLFIDEGFGTQDEHGRDRLVESINAIQDEFDLILVITHIEELKDAFPARIEVTKTNSGSVIDLI